MASIQLSDLIHLASNFFRPPPTTVRTTERKILIVPLHEAVNKPQMQPVIAAATEQIVRTNLIWKWIKSDGKGALVRWDMSQQIFLKGSLEDWSIWLGDNFRVHDTNNVEYRGPSIVVTDRLIAAVLAHPETRIADWALQLRMKRENAETK